MKDETVVKAMDGFCGDLKEFCDALREKYGKKAKKKDSSPAKRRRSNANDTR